MGLIKPANPAGGGVTICATHQFLWLLHIYFLIYYCTKNKKQNKKMLVLYLPLNNCATLSFPLGILKIIESRQH